MSLIKVLDYNVWHGLSGEGLLNFGELEPRRRRERRFQSQIDQIKELDPDVIFLQEVCPIEPRLNEFQNALDMDGIFQIDQSGLKIFGKGIPNNLSSGLVILARRGWKLRKLLGLRLSGHLLGFNFSKLSFQVSEFRYALFGRMTVGNMDFLLCNTHLHHGPVPSSILDRRLKDLAKTNASVARRLDGIQSAVQLGDERRRGELNQLAAMLRQLKSGPTILCGDLNVEPDDSTLNVLKACGLTDVFHASDVLTWDPPHNTENHKHTRNLRLPINTYGVDQLTQLFIDYDRRPRRIDHFWTNQIVQDQKLVLNQPLNGLVGSDHFGLMAELVL